MTMNTTNQTNTKTPRQGRTNLKQELIEKLWPLTAINQGENILLELNRYRFMTNQQVADLLFRNLPNQRKQPYSLAGAKDAADLSLKRLFESQLIERKMVWQTSNPYNKPLKAGEARLKPTTLRAPVNVLTRAGSKLIPSLLEERGLSDDDLRWTSRLANLTDQNIAHELEIIDAAIAMRRSIRAIPELSVLAWRDDQQLQALTALGKTAMRGFTPDGLCLVEVVTGSHTSLIPLFLEIDRQTETIRGRGGSTTDWASKITRYGAYLAELYRYDPIWRELGLTDEDIEMLGNPRVLTITTNPGRVQRMIAATKLEGGKGAYLYTTKDLAYGEWGGILGQIWRSPLTREHETVSLLDVLLKP